MAHLAIQKYTDPEALPESTLEKIQEIGEIIRRRAYSLFESRNPGCGSDLEDWLKAERESVWLPVSELADEGTEFRIRVALPGLDPKQVHVTAMRDALIVQGDVTHSHDRHSGDICFCEFSQGKLFRRFNLPVRIDINGVAASLEKGILQITAPKAARQMTAAAA